MSKIIQKSEFILASSSPVRKEILEGLGFDFKAISPDFDEEKAKEKVLHLEISQRALFLARGKAKSISVKHKDAIVIGSDQICEISSGVVNKPKNQKEAIIQLNKLNGRVHYQNNAVCIFRNGEELFSNIQKATLKMRILSEAQIKSYIKLDDPVGCAGSYKIESLGRHLFSEITGDIACISGIAIQPVLHFLHQNQLIKL